MNLSIGMNSRRYALHRVFGFRVSIAASERGSRRNDVHALFGSPNGFAELKAKLKLTRGQREPTIRESDGRVWSAKTCSHHQPRGQTVIRIALSTGPHHLSSVFARSVACATIWRHALTKKISARFFAGAN